MKKTLEQQKEYDEIIEKYLSFMHKLYKIPLDDQYRISHIFTNFPPPEFGMFPFYDRSENRMFDEIKKECLEPQNKVIASEVSLQLHAHGSLTNNAFILPDNVNISFNGIFLTLLLSSDLSKDPFRFEYGFFKKKDFPEFDELKKMSFRYYEKNYLNGENYHKELYTVLRAIRYTFQMYSMTNNNNNNSNNMPFYPYLPPRSLCPDISYSTKDEEIYTEPIQFFVKIHQSTKNVNKLFLFNNTELYLSDIIHEIVTTFLNIEEDKHQRISDPIHINIYSSSCLNIPYSIYLREYPRYLLNRCLNYFPLKYNLKHLGVSPYDKIDKEIRRASLDYERLLDKQYINQRRLDKHQKYSPKLRYNINIDPPESILLEKVLNDDKINFFKFEKSMSEINAFKLFTFFNQVIKDDIYQKIEKTKFSKSIPISDTLKTRNYRCKVVELIIKTAYFREWSLVLKEFPEVEVPPQFKFLVETMQGSIEQLQWLIEQKKRDKSLNNIPNMTEGYDYVEYMMKKGYKNLKESSIQDGDFTKDERFLSEIIDTLNWIINNDLYYYQNILNENVRYENNDLFTVFLYTLKVLSNNYLNLNYKYGVTSLVYNLTPPSFDKEIFPFIFPYDIRAFIQKQLPFYRIVLKKYKTLCSDENENKASCAEIERQIDNKLVESEPYLYSTCNFLSSLPCFFIYLNKYLHSTELDIKGLNEYLDELYPSAKSVFDDRNMLSYTPDRGLYFLLKQFIHYVRHKINTK